MDVILRVKRVALLLSTLLALVGPGGKASAAVPQGVWMVDGRAALQIYDCNGLMCGRLRWLDTPRAVRGEPNATEQPDPTLRQRDCVVYPAGDLRPRSRRWEGGYSTIRKRQDLQRRHEHTSSDQLVARVYGSSR
jgi:hypothetical protein